MKVFTKEYYDLVDQRFLSDELEFIDDKMINNHFIEKLIEENKLQYINEMIESFENGNNGLDLLIDMIERDNEVLSVEEKQQILDDFKNEFMNDQEPQVLEIDDLSKEYDETFKQQLENLGEYYPQFLIDRVDPRLLVLSCVPESLKVDLEKFDQETEEKISVLEKDISNYLEIEKMTISSIIVENLVHEFAEITGFDVLDKKGILKIKRDDFPYSHDEFNDQVIFHDCVILENELIINEEDFTYLIESEIYLKENGYYEVHLLLEQNDLYYLTLECSDISFRRVP